MRPVSSRAGTRDAVIVLPEPVTLEYWKKALGVVVTRGESSVCARADPTQAAVARLIIIAVSRAGRPGECVVERDSSIVAVAPPWGSDSWSSLISYVRLNLTADYTTRQQHVTSERAIERPMLMLFPKDLT